MAVCRPRTIHGGCWWSLVRRSDDKRKQNIRGKRGNCKDEKRECPDTSGASPCFVNFCGRETWVNFEDRIDVELANVGGDIEEERKPAHPRKELYGADHADRRRKTPHGDNDLAEK